MEIKELRDKVSLLWKELETMKKKNEAEGVQATPEERSKANGMLDEIDELENQISNIELNERTKKMEDKIKSSRSLQRTDITDVRQNRGFKNMGEFLQAVVNYYVEGNVIDQRLTRAASGMSESVPADGGFLVQTEFAAELLKRTYTTGQVVSRCRKIPVGVNSNGLKINAIAESSRASGSRWGGILGYWLAEAGSKTASAPTFRQIELNLKKLIGLCYATDELLQDSAALESVINQAFPEEFGFLLDDAAINGTGVGQPMGVMKAPCLVTVGRNTGATVLTEDIIAMWAQCYAPSRQNAVWFINQDVEPKLYVMSLAVGTAGGQLTYMPPGGLSNAPYATLMGRPVIPIEQCQSLGTSGDIILADMSQYIIIDKGGINSASSIHVKFTTDETTFRFVYRVDGQPWWAKALTPFKGSKTLGPFVVLS